MNREFEKHLAEAWEIAHAAPAEGNFESEAQRTRVLDILSALRGYLTEIGTTDDEDDLLRDIGVLPPKVPPMQRHDDVGEIMPLGNWRQAVKDGSYTDNDGIGCLATETHVSDLEIAPSDAEVMRIPPWVTHVVWYNK